jgi:hypothetical protein
VVYTEVAGVAWSHDLRAASASVEAVCLTHVFAPCAPTGSYGNFSSCPDPGTRRLIVSARCYPDLVTVNGMEYRRSDAILGLAVRLVGNTEH